MALAPYFCFNLASLGARTFVDTDFLALRFFEAAVAVFVFDR